MNKERIHRENVKHTVPFAWHRHGDRRSDCGDRYPSTDARAGRTVLSTNESMHFGSLSHLLGTAWRSASIWLSDLGGASRGERRYQTVLPYSIVRAQSFRTAP